MNIGLKRKSLIFCLALLMIFSCMAAAQNSRWKARDKWQNVSGIVRALDISEGSWIADVGAQEGYLTLRLAPIVGDMGRIFSVDIDEKALGKLHKNLKKKNIENVTVVYSLPDNPMLPKESLDAVVIINSYHEMDDYEAMLKHIKKALKPGGRLLIVEPISDELSDSSRRQQSSEHEIALRFARKDLHSAGFEIIEERKSFVNHPRHDNMWLLVVRRPIDNTND